MSHMTGRCTYGNPATITLANSIMAKTYGPWIESKQDESLLFVNHMPDLNRITLPTITAKVRESKMRDNVAPEDGMLIEKLQVFFSNTKRTNLKPKNQRLENEAVIFQNELEKSCVDFSK